MVTAFMIAAALQGPVVTAGVNRTTVEFGDTLVLSITVNSRGIDWVRLSDPELEGLDAYGSHQVSNVRRVEGEEERRTERLVYLRAIRSGSAKIGEVRVQQGRRVATTDPISILVTGEGPTDPGRNPIVARMIERAPPPSDSSEVSVFIVPSANSVTVGQQLDLLVFAWVPRVLRNRLRTAPTLQPPQFSGAWGYETDLPPDLIEEKTVGNHVFDLYVHHQTIFPISRDGFAINRATVSYNLPLSDSFMSRELRHVVQSEIPEIELVPLPDPGTGPVFSGSTADSLTMTAALSRRSSEVGGAVTLEVTLAGRGNVVLWGEPIFNWPVGLNAYPGETSVENWRSDGEIFGRKIFRYLLVPDSIGMLNTRVKAYRYFDPVSKRYRSAPSVTATLVARASSGALVSSTDRLPLIAAGGQAPVDDLFLMVPVWVWVTLILAGPAIVFAVRIGEGRRSVVRKQTPVARTSLWQINNRFGEVLRSVSPECALLEGPSLEQTLVAAGVDRSLASHAVRIKDRLGKANYGPDGEGDTKELVAEVDEMARALAGDKGPTYTQRLRGVLALMFFVLVPNAGAQELTAERLYHAGAFVVAADSFAVRATNDPRVAAHWSNLGNAMFHSGRTGKAVAAWVRAGRLAPRNRANLRALQKVPAWQGGSQAALHPITPVEAFIAAIVLWLSGWLMIILGHRKVARYALTLAVMVGLAGELVRRQYDRPTGIVLGDETPLREAPYGTSDRTKTLSAGEAVDVRQTDGAWLLVRHGEAVGWILSREIEHI